MKYFITGATGFIGGHLVPKLIARGHSVVCLVRNPAKGAALTKLGATLVTGDVTDRASMRAPMQGVDGVFHVAAWYAAGKIDRAKMQAANVDGTRNTLELAIELGVPKIVYTSTVGVFGNTHDQIVDETCRVEQRELSTVYEQTKWAAHYEVAVPLQQRGAPIVIVQPGGVTGPGDVSPQNDVYKFFLRRMPIMLGATAGLTWAHVDDIAEGHILAMEKGRVGEAYIIAGPSLTYKTTMQIFEKITGIPAPRIWMPDWVIRGLTKCVGALERGFNAKLMLSAEVLSTLANYTWYVTSAKSQRELGWQTRPIEQTFKEVLDYERAKMKK